MFLEDRSYLENNFEESQEELQEELQEESQEESQEMTTDELLIACVAKKPPLYDHRLPRGCQTNIALKKCSVAGGVQYDGRYVIV
jgi:hypothetical protein